MLRTKEDKSFMNPTMCDSLTDVGQLLIDTKGFHFPQTFSVCDFLDNL